MCGSYSAVFRTQHSEANRPTTGALSTDWAPVSTQCQVVAARDLAATSRDLWSATGLKERDGSRDLAKHAALGRRAEWQRATILFAVEKKGGKGKERRSDKGAATHILKDITISS